LNSKDRKTIQQGDNQLHFSRKVGHPRQLGHNGWRFVGSQNCMIAMNSDSAVKIRTGERLLLATGLMLMAFWVLARVHGSIASRAAIERFRADAVASTGTSAPAWDGFVPDSAVNFTLWNPKRVKAYRDSLSAKTDLPLAILRIPKINLEVPVFNDTDDLTLNRGVGRILGTAQIGQLGNLGIAGHRDGFFRGLKDMGKDDIIELIRPERTDQYVITQIQTVDPKDVSVLASTPAPTLTLVTCFPFYYIGNAPQRYVVTAAYQISTRPEESASKNSISTGKKTNKKEKQDGVN
jgi:sortase A